MASFTLTLRPGLPIAYEDPDDVEFIGSGDVLGDLDFNTGVQLRAADLEHYGIVAAPLPAVDPEVFDKPELSAAVRAFISAQYLPDVGPVDPGSYTVVPLRLGTLADGWNFTYGNDAEVLPDQMGAYYNSQVDPNLLEFIKPALIAGTAHMFAMPTQPLSWTIYDEAFTWIWEYELNLTWFVPDRPLVAAPRRLYPVDRTRLFPRPTSRQQGSRQTGYW